MVVQKKLKTILLVDDDEATNFINNIVLKRLEIADSIVITKNGHEAIEYLTSSKNGAFPQPDLIFLDINMPGMNGWEFLEAYEALNENQLAKVVLVMLSTSLNPDDQNKANQNSNVNGFKSKPLTLEMIEEVFTDFFPQHLTTE